MTRDPNRKYLIPIASKVLDVLDAFESPQQELTLQQVIERTGVPHTTAFRILFTLAHRGALIQSGKKYRLAAVRRRIKVGCAGLSQEVAISVAACRSLERVARQTGIDLLVVDNRYDARVALENARQLVESRVDVAIEFQNDVQAAPAIADVFGVARIPLIALHIPHPGAIYFGPDNYRAGWTAGSALANHARHCWGGKFDLVLLLDIAQGGPFLQSRMSGVLAGLEHALGPVPQGMVAREDGAGDRRVSKEAVLRVLGKRPGARRILASATSDESALGIVDALQEAGADRTAAIVGHDGTEEALQSIATDSSPFIGTVGFFPENYGAALVEIIFKLLRSEQVPPFVYVKHALMERARLHV
jgi:ribose transport system substrate-binding protein